jgi:hypothetical protein
LKDFDPELCKNLEMFLEIDIDDFEFTFSYDKVIFGKTVTLELIKDGANIKVIDDNEKLYIKKYFYAKMT